MNEYGNGQLPYQTPTEYDTNTQRSQQGGYQSTPGYQQPQQPPQQQFQQPQQPVQQQGAYQQADFQQQPYQGQPPYPPQQGYPNQQSGQIGAKSKVAAGLLGILLGAFGAHKFYMGWTGPAVIMLLVTLLTFGIGAVVMAVIGLIEGIIYLTKNDYDFYYTYELGGKTWF